MSLLQMSLHASALILFAMLLRALLLHRLPKRTFVFLWLLAAARMLIPVELPFRWSAEALLLRAFPALGSILPGAELAARGAIASPGTLAASGAASTVRETVFSTSVLRASAPALSPWRIAWLAGLIACALLLLIPHLRWRRAYARSLPLEDANVESWLRAHPLRLRRVRVRISDEIPTPLTCGLLRPAILLPAATFDRSDPARLGCVLEHELTHIRRLDVLAKLIFAAALCAHWFNPLAWALYLLANRDIELACDEAVLQTLDDTARRDYARALLDLAAQQSGMPAPLASGFGRQMIEERIRAIMKAKHLTRIAAIAAALLIAFSALAFATGAEGVQIPASPEIEELLFDGWEETSVRDYAAILEVQPEIENPDDCGLPDDYLQYVYYPLLRVNFDSPQTFGGGIANADTGETLMNYEVVARITDPDRLTVGELRDALRGVQEGLEGFDCESATQDALQDYAMELATRWSDGERIVFDILAELPGPDSPYADPLTLAYLQQYAPLGLEYDYSLGNLSMRYEGTEIRAVIDPEVGVTVSNSAGPDGLGGEGPFLRVEYEGGRPAALRLVTGQELR